MAQQQRIRMSSRPSTRSSGPSTHASELPPASSSFLNLASTSTSTRASSRAPPPRPPSQSQPVKCPLVPVGVPRPPTSSRPLRTLRPTVPRPDSLILVQGTPSPPARAASKRRSTTPSVSPAPTPPRSTTPTGEPPPPAPAAHPAALRGAPAAQAAQRFPSSCLRPEPPAPPHRAATPAPAPASPPPRKRPRLHHHSSPPSRPAPPPTTSSASCSSSTAQRAPVPPLLLTTDFTSLDPASTYALGTSLLFRLEYVARGAPTYEQGGKRGYGAAAAARWEAERARARATREGDAKGKGRERDREGDRGEVPSWARTDDGTEWEEDVLRRLSSRLAAPLSSSSSSASDSLIPLLFASDVSSLRGPLRLGDAGAALECYLVGREWPVRAGVWTGWVVAREWRERDNAWVYAVDDGTAVLEVVCPSATLASSSSSTTTLRGITSPHAHLPLLLPRSNPTTSCSSARAVSPRKALAAAQFAHLERRAADQSEGVVVDEGECVRVVGRVEERRMVWDEGRRVVALRMDILDDPNALPAHHALTAQLHRSLYPERFDARARLAAIERDEREALQRAWEGASCATGTTGGGGGSEWGGRGGGSVASSPGRGVHYRPTRPSKLAREDLTLSNFVIYVRHHLRKRYVLASALPSVSSAAWRSSSPSSPSSPSSSSTTTHDPSTAEVALPFTLAALQANKHLSLFASRLAQEHARTEKPSQRKPRRAWVARPANAGQGAHHAARGSVGRGAASLLLPPPSSGAAARRQGLATREEGKEGEEDAAPLEGEELDRAVERVWREVIRTMRKAGMVVQCVEEEEDEGEGGGAGAGQAGEQREEDLPDLPRWERGRLAPPRTPQRSRGPPILQGDADATPRAAPETTSAPPPASGCPWGDVKLFGPDDGDDDDEVQSQVGGLQTPRATRLPAPPRPPPVPRPRASPPRPDTSAWSLSSSSTSAHPHSSSRSEQSFSLVTPGTLAPLVLSLLSSLYSNRPSRAAGAPRSSSSSISERDLRIALHGDERWAAVAQFSEAVGKALALLADEGRVERHGEGWRPAGVGRRTR